MEENQRAPLSKRALFSYIVIALGFTWACWIPSLLWAKQADYVLPTLQANYSQRKAIWIMGLIWAVWHYPFTIYVTLASFDPASGIPAAAQ